MVIKKTIILKKSQGVDQEKEKKEIRNKKN